MTTFNYTGSALNNLVGGTPGANVSNLVQLLNDVKTYINGANIDDTQLVSPTNAVWRSVLQVNAGSVGVISTTPAYFTNGGNSQSSGGSTATGIHGLWIPPTSGDIAVAGKTTRLRLRVAWATNPTAPAITITWGLYPVTSFGGGAGVIGIGMGTVIAGTTVSVASPAANSTAILTGTSFDFSAVTGATGYVIGLVGSGSQAANSFVSTSAILEMRHT